MFFASVAAAQQEDQKQAASSSVWLAYIGEHSISEAWDLHLEGQVFWNGALETRELVFVRPGVRRRFPHGLSALITYGYFAKEPAITGASRALGEHRLSEDLQWKHPLLEVGAKRLTLTHRLRAEQRLEAENSRSENGAPWQFAERLRYRLTANVPFPGNVVVLKPDYVSIYNEVFVNVGLHSGQQTLDLNIVSGAVGWNITSTLHCEIGYLLAYSPSPAGLVGMYNHVTQINLTSSGPFHKKKS
jgi:Protein of unknown function (DUF2490)